MEQDADKSIPSTGDRDGSALCRTCGLCCRGVWFSHVKLDGSEIESARRLGLPIEMVNGHAQFQQSCVLHDGKGCTAYQTWRPRRCMEYRCSLLNRFDAGEVTFDEARRHVITARAIADRVQNEVGPIAGGLLGNALLNRLEATPGGDINGVPPLPLPPMTKLDAVALRIYFDRHFRKGKPSPREEV